MIPLIICTFIIYALYVKFGVKALLIISLLLSTLATLFVLSTLAPNADFEGGSGYAIMFATMMAIPAVLLALVPNFYRNHKSRLSLISLLVGFTPFVVFATILLVEQASALRTDLSAAVKYMGEHDAITFECTDKYGSSSGREARRGEVVAIDSVRGDGRIVISWGPPSGEKQKADLSAAGSIPKGGGSVIVMVTLTDEGASFVIEQNGAQ